MPIVAFLLLYDNSLLQKHAFTKWRICDIGIMTVDRLLLRLLWQLLINKNNTIQLTKYHATRLSIIKFLMVRVP